MAKQTLRIPVTIRFTEEMTRQIDAARRPYGLRRSEWIRLVLPTCFGDDRIGEKLDRIVELLEESFDDGERLQRGLKRLAFVMLTQVANLDKNEAAVHARSLLSNEEDG